MVIRMQKRTNPLQLKVKEEFPDKRPAESITETVPPVARVSTTANAPTAPSSSTVQAAAPTAAKAPARPVQTSEDVRVAGSAFVPIRRQGQEKASAVAQSPARTVFSPIPSLKERLATTVVASDPPPAPEMPETSLDEAYAASEDTYETYDVQDETVVEDVGVIDDTQPLPDSANAPETDESEEKAEVEECRLEDDGYSEEDYAMAARFRLSGHTSRRLVIGKISRDLCYLAQVLHPDQKLTKILENALLTRLYLENRDAFDALAMRIEEKGGHIKC